MTTTDRNTTMSSNDPLETLLRQASPRPVPPPADEAAVRDAVQAEWRTITRRHRVRRSVSGFAIAATVLLAVFVSLNSLRQSDVTEIQVASISRSFGSIYLPGEQAEQRETNKMMATGQTVATGSKSGIGLEWLNGGSLRLDENTRVMFVSAEEIFLQSGRVYFDSLPFGTKSAVKGTPARNFRIRTGHGVVTHHGTQFMTSTDAEDLSVSVREGQVTIAGNQYDETVSSGRRVTFTGSRRPSIVNIKGFGEDWNWVEKTSSPVDFDDRTVHELLLWTSRETGLQLHFESEAAEQMAHDGTLKGSYESTDPMNTLRFWMRGIDLDYRIENGVIYISKP